MSNDQNLQALTLGERIVLAARLATERHLELKASSAERISAARRRVVATGGAGAVMVTDDLTPEQPSIGARGADLRPRAPRAAAEEQAMLSGAFAEGAD